MVKVVSPEGDWSPFFKLAWDSLCRNEFTALTALFHGAKKSVIQFNDSPSHVFFGKEECEWVDFETVWKGKFVEMGLITLTVTEEREHCTTYEIKPTPWGRALIHEWCNHPISDC